MALITIRDIPEIVGEDLSDDAIARSSGNHTSRAAIKLIYRGLTFDYNLDQRTVDREIHPINQTPYNLIYRGITYHIDPRTPKPPSTKPHSYELICRGCTYQVIRDEAGMIRAITPSTRVLSNTKLFSK
jgi:hypothetical protein